MTISWTTAPQASQYQRKDSVEPAARARSTTRPTVPTGRCGECGTPAGASHSLAGPDRDVADVVSLAQPQPDVALELVEELGDGVDVVVQTSSATGDDEHPELVVDDGWGGPVIDIEAVICDPARQVDGIRRSVAHFGQHDSLRPTTL